MSRDEERSDEEALVSLPMERDEASVLLASWRCCGAPSVCGARCMDDEESHRLAQFAAFIDNEQVNNSGLLAALAAAREDNERLRNDVKRQTERADSIEAIEGRARALAQDRAAAAQVEVTQLQARAEKLTETIEARYKAIRRDVYGDDWEAGRASGVYWVLQQIRSLAEPLGSTPDQPATEEAKSMCVTCGNYHPTANHWQCAANEAAGLHADGLDPNAPEGDAR